MKTIVPEDNDGGTLIPVISSIQIAEWANKEPKHVNRDIEEMLIQLYGDGPDLDHAEIQGVMKELDGRGYTKQWLLDEDHATCLGAGYCTKVRMRIVKELRALKENQAPQLPDFADPVLMARTWADDQEAKRELQLNYTESERTKAHISDKKTATAMNTASQAVKRANRLAAENEEFKKQEAERDERCSYINLSELLVKGLIAISAQRAGKILLEKKAIKKFSPEQKEERKRAGRETRVPTQLGKSLGLTIQRVKNKNSKNGNLPEVETLLVIPSCEEALISWFKSQLEEAA